MSQGKEAAILQDSLCSLVNAILIRCGDMCEEAMVKNIVTMIIALFKSYNSVTESGLIILNGLAYGCPEKLELDEICKYLKHALESKENACARLACGIISDLAYGRPEKIIEYLDDFVPCLQELLRDNSLDRMIKVHALRSLGDLAMNCGQQYA